MKLINKSSNVSLILQAKNSTGGILDLTSASITVTFKLYETDATSLFVKQNTAAGGSDAEVEVLSASLGYYAVKILVANTSSLTARTIYAGISIVIGSATYTDALYFKIIENKGTSTASYRTKGTTAQRPTLNLYDDGFQYFDTDLESPFWWNGTEWV